MNALEIYILNVGEGDTAIIRTPTDKIILIDVVDPEKTENVLQNILPSDSRDIAHLIITHPHRDHYAGVDYMVENYTVANVILAPFLHEPGTAMYHAIINLITARHIPVRFLSGHETLYPDGGTFPYSNDNMVCLDLLGPSNHLLSPLWNAKRGDANHLSIITRLAYGKFEMVLSGDAQMENWAHYDEEGMLGSCDVLKAAHHGSKNGTQWERLARLAPGLVIVSGDPAGRHAIPDTIGSATFFEYITIKKKEVVLTSDCGTVRITVPKPETASYKTTYFNEHKDELVFPNGSAHNATEREPAQGTDWLALVAQRVS